MAWLAKGKLRFSLHFFLCSAHLFCCRFRVASPDAVPTATGINVVATGRFQVGTTGIQQPLVVPTGAGAAQADAVWSDAAIVPWPVLPPTSDSGLASRDEGKNERLASALKLLFDNGKAAEWDGTIPVDTVLNDLLDYGNLSKALKAKIQPACASVYTTWRVDRLSVFEPTSQALEKDPPLGLLLNLSSTTVTTGRFLVMNNAGVTGFVENAPPLTGVVMEALTKQQAQTGSAHVTLHVGGSAAAVARSDPLLDGLKSLMTIRVRMTRAELQ
jgi:hypothetical protein